MTPAALVDLWKNKFLLRVATKMTLGNTLGSAVLDVLNNTATLEVEVPSAGPGTGMAERPENEKICYSDIVSLS